MISLRITVQSQGWSVLYSKIILTGEISLQKQRMFVIFTIYRSSFKNLYIKWCNEWLLSLNKHRFFFFLISFVRITYKTICLKAWCCYKTHWKIKAGKVFIDLFQKMRIKNLRGVSKVRLKKLDSFTLETSKNHLIRNFLRNGRLRVNFSLRIFSTLF